MVPKLILGKRMRTRGSALRKIVQDGRRLERLAPLVISFLLLAPATGAAADPLTCGHSQEPRVVLQLLFGRGNGDAGSIAQADWSDFVAHELTPRFPDGFTVIDSNGQWLNPNRGVIIKESSEVVEIVLPGDTYDASKVDAAIDAYKRRFRALSVGLIVQTACVRF
jgi:Protein of unknown function (DUF3574)